MLPVPVMTPPMWRRSSWLPESMARDWFRVMGLLMVVALPLAPPFWSLPMMALPVPVAVTVMALVKVFLYVV